MHYELLAKLAATLVLAVMTWQDLRNKQVSNWLTIPALLASAAVWPIFRGDWVVPVYLAALLFLVDMSPKPVRLSLTVGGLLLFGNLALSPEAMLVIAAWGAFYALWNLNLIAGADAKAAMALVGFWPQMEMIGLILVSHLTVGLFFLVWRYGRAAPRQMFTALLRGLTGAFPSREELDRDSDPMLLAYSLAGVVFVWGFWG